MGERGIGLRSITEQLDTTTVGGNLIFHIFSALAEFERSIIRERTVAGLAAARARGRTGGRPRSLGSADLAVARALLADRGNRLIGWRPTGVDHTVTRPWWYAG